MLDVVPDHIVIVPIGSALLAPPPPPSAAGAQAEPFHFSTSLLFGAVLETLARSSRLVGFVGLSVRSL